MKALYVESSDSSDDDDVEVVLKHLVKMLMKKKSKKVTKKEKETFVLDASSVMKKDIMKNECPLLKKEKEKGKDTWC